MLNFLCGAGVSVRGFRGFNVRALGVSKVMDIRATPHPSLPPNTALEIRPRRGVSAPSAGVGRKYSKSPERRSENYCRSIPLSLDVREGLTPARPCRGSRKSSGIRIPRIWARRGGKPISERIGRRACLPSPFVGHSGVRTSRCVYPLPYSSVLRIYPLILRGDISYGCARRPKGAFDQDSSFVDVNCAMDRTFPDGPPGRANGSDFANRGSPLESRYSIFLSE